MRIKFLFLVKVILISLLFSCESKFEMPLVFTGDVTSITDTSALFTAKVSNLGESSIVESGFIWGVRPKYNNGIKVVNEHEVTDVFSLKANKKLVPHKKYYVRAYIKTEATVSYGREVTFVSCNENDNCDLNAQDTGRWFQAYNDTFGRGFCRKIKSSFTIGDYSYFAIENGSLYCYNKNSNSFTKKLSDNILVNADFATVYNGEAYIFTKNALYLYNPLTNFINKLSVLNENEFIYWVSGFKINENIYIGLGSSITHEYSKNFWCYNIPNNTWTAIKDFPGEYRRNGFAYVVENLGYIGGGFNLNSEFPNTKFRDLWCYFPELDEWMQKESLPFSVEAYYDLQTTNNIGIGYCFHKNKLYEYNSVFDYWEKKAQVPPEFKLCEPHVFSLDKNIYVLGIRETTENMYFNLLIYEK